jgi:hypothetical protein
MKLKECNACLELRPIWKNDEGFKYCKNCWVKKNPPKSATKSKILNPKSAKREVLDKLYSRLRKKYLEANPYCVGRIAGCTGKSTDIHHKKGRGKHYLEQETWISVCRNCHQWIENNPHDAKLLGLSISRIADIDDD